jgi:hypothetical protein
LRRLLGDVAMGARLCVGLRGGDSCGVARLALALFWSGLRRLLGDVAMGARLCVGLRGGDSCGVARLALARAPL